MRLLITQQYDRSFEENVSKLATHMLQLPTTHLFIASNSWEEVYIELDDTIPECSLLHVNMVTDSIKVKLPEVVNHNTIKQLSELFPAKAGLIRKSFMTGQDMKGVLGDCIV